MLNRLISKLAWRQHANHPLSFKDNHDLPYHFGQKMGFAVADCHVYADNERVASFQMMKFIRSDNMLVVDSFIVEKAQRGQGLGKRCMHDFAAMLAEEAPDVRGIRFDLRCSGAGLDVPQMARALERLLSAIGARGIMLRAPNENTRVVSALWLKTDW